MNKRKIINDPVYGFITIPFPIVFDLIEHPFFQRLRRIKQLSLTHYVYPGALHTRFHHALGAMHLMTQAIEVLRSKFIEITEKEAEAVIIAILLHDIGHGPFSHTLEHTLMKVHHEEVSVWLMEQLNEEMQGKLSLAIQIFKNEYPKPYLNQLVSGQLDMDRLDYLNRDSFFTGVSEGVIGYDRIIKMLNVQNDVLVVEEKGLYSIEKFLIARRIMYWQVYLHKTVLSAELMLIEFVKRLRELVLEGQEVLVSGHLKFFLEGHEGKDRTEIVRHFTKLDDVDIVAALKNASVHKDTLLSFLAKSILNRKLFRLEMQKSAFGRDYIEEIRHKIASKLQWKGQLSTRLVLSGKESNRAYNTQKDEILILFKNGTVKPLSDCTEHSIGPQIISKHYLCYPK